MARKDIEHTIFNDSVFIISNNMLPDAEYGSKSYREWLTLVASVVQNIGGYSKTPVFLNGTSFTSSGMNYFADMGETASRFGRDGCVGVFIEMDEDERKVYDKVKQIITDTSDYKMMFLRASILELLVEKFDHEKIVNWYKLRWLDFTEKEIEESCALVKSVIAGNQ